MAELRLDGQRLTVRLERDGRVEEPVDVGLDGPPFQLWAERYDELRHHMKPGELLLGLGREMYAFLDQGSRWLSGLRAGAQNQHHLEVVIETPPDDSELARWFVAAPWELLAPEIGGPLVSEVGSRVLRRVGAPAATDGAVSEHRLYVLFMAGSPRGVEPRLDYDAEEAAILEACRGRGERASRIDLVVEESGCVEWLRPRMALGDSDSGPVSADVLHLSCHGRAQPKPLLVLEDPFGERAEIDAAALVDALAGREPKLLFLCACRTADGGAASDSLAVEAIQAGVPAVLGWSGGVYDDDATAFAAEVYGEIAVGGALAHAVDVARRALWNRAEGLHSHWHRARLYLGKSRGGRLVTGKDHAPSRLPPGGGQQAFLDAKGQQVPVASRREFVSRRREIQAVLRAFADGEPVLLRGMGQNGKSSLAARVVERLPEHALALVFGGRSPQGVAMRRFHAADVLRAIQGAVTTDAARQAVDDALQAVLRDERAFEGKLVDLLTRHLGQGEQPPLLLVLDDLEQILEANPAGAHTVLPQLSSGLAAVLRVFRRYGGRNHLLLTSRYTFTLPDADRDLGVLLVQIGVPAFGASEAKLQAEAWARARDDRREPTAVQRRESIEASAGTPGLLRMLLDLLNTDEAAWRRAVDSMKAWLAEGQAPQDEQTRSFLARLLIRELLALLSEDETRLLQAVARFKLPVPLLDVLIEKVAPGLDPRRLQGLGVLELCEDIVQPATSKGREPRMAVSVHRVMRPALPSLTEEVGRRVELEVLPVLVERWGETLEERHSEAHRELFRLSLEHEDPGTLALSGEAVLRWFWERGEYRTGAPLAKRVLSILDRARLERPCMLAIVTGDLLVADGECQLAMECFRLVLESPSLSLMTGGSEHALLLTSRGRLLLKSGDVDGAMSDFELARGYCTHLGLQREVAVLDGDIAEIYLLQGNVRSALRLHEERLLVFNRLGASRDRAEALVDIARIRLSQGDAETALRLMKEAQEAFDGLGFSRERGVMLVDIARIHLCRGDLMSALHMYEEGLAVFHSLGDARECALAQMGIAQIRSLQGDVESALRLLEEALAVFERLKETRERAVSLGEIAAICFHLGDVERALQLHEEELVIYDRLGDARERAVTQVLVAEIRRSQGKLDCALRLLEEARVIFEHLEAAREHAVALRSIARVRWSCGDAESALLLLDEARVAFERLGAIRERAETLNDIAIVYLAQGDEGTALVLHNEALILFERLGVVRGRAEALGGIARVYMAQGDFEGARRLQSERLAAHESLKYADGIAAAHHELSESNSAVAEHAVALRHLEVAFPIFVRIRRLDRILAVGRKLLTLHREDNNRSAAIEVLRTLISSLRSLGHAQEAAEFEAELAQLEASGA